MLTPRQRLPDRTRQAGYGALTKRPDHSEKNPAPVAVATDGQMAPAHAGPGKSPFHDFQIDWKLSFLTSETLSPKLDYLPTIDRRMVEPAGIEPAT
jgi:hypothetical protein